jgi:Mrp family chromosome partitioning ATPase
MSNVTLNKPALPNERHVTNGLATSRLVRFPQTTELSSQRVAIEDAAFNGGVRSFYRQLSSFRSPDGKSIQTLGLTSCYQHEGKSTVGECLASIAAESQRVLFIDANESLISIHKGLRDLALNGVAVPNYGALIGQTRQTVSDPRPGEATNRQPTIDEMRNLLCLLSVKFELIVLDLPPLDSTNLLDWAPLLNGVVLVIESERVRWQVAARGIELLENAGTQVLGTILNKQRQYIPQWLYQRL